MRAIDPAVGLVLPNAQRPARLIDMASLRLSAPLNGASRTRECASAWRSARETHVLPSG